MCLTLSILLALCFNGWTVNAEEVQTKDLLIEDTLLIYTPEEMLSFNIQDYLQENAPHLTEYAEIISHWSGYSSISPKIIIALLEHQTGLVSKNILNQDDEQRPLSFLSEKVGFSEQIKDIATQISNSYYLQRNVQQKSTQNTLQNFLKKKSNVLRGEQDQEFNTTYYCLFPKIWQDKSTLNNQDSDVLLGAMPADDLLQLPTPIGESWSFGGSHTNTGSGSYPQSSLDFNAGSWSWGTDTSNIWVVASNAGTIVKHSSCFVEVIGSGGWSTTYYHLDNIQVSTNQTVTRNAHLANYADNQAQALCGGGSSTGPHVHFSLKNNGSYQHLDGVKLSGYSVHTGRDSYDTDCNYFWMDENGTKHCAWSNLYNPGVVSTLPDLVVQSPSVNITTLSPGQPFTTSVTVLNQGSGSSSSSTLRYYRSVDNTISSSDFELFTDSVPSLAAGNTSLENAALEAPNTSGTYWIGACVDFVTSESNTANNCSSGVQITVAPLNGDVNNDYVVNLKDLIFVLQVIVDISPTDPISIAADVNNDMQIGNAEAIYILRETAGLNE